MSKSEADKAGLNDEDRLFYIRIDRGKANYLPPATKATWFHLQSVELPNGEQVGTISPWEFPGQEGSQSAAKTEADRRAEELFLNLLARLTLAGVDVTATNSRSGAPHVFSRQPEAKAAKIGQLAIEAAMDRLIAAGRICVEHEGRHGRKVSYLRAKQ
jgi:hypothetical protein